MKVLYYDTETTGLVQNNLPADHPAQPHLVQLGAVLTEHGVPKARVSLIVRPENWSIPEQATRTHGITTETAAALGVPLLTALATFTQLRALADELVAFNLPFDELVMAAAIARSGRTPASPGPSRRTCCMALTTELIDLPPTAKMRAAGFDKPKPPSLAEAYRYFFGKDFFGKDFAGAHDALNDAVACLEVHQEFLKRRSAREG